VRIVVEEKKKMEGIPATRPVLNIGIGIGAADDMTVGERGEGTGMLRKAVFTGLGKIQRGWTVTGDAS